MDEKSPEPHANEKRVPAHLVAGPLGVGKTTTVLEAIATAPPNERWAVIVNEYGKVAIDGTLFSEAEDRQTGKLYVKEIAGGCICCGSGQDFASAICSVIESVAPDRIIIEPTGLANVPELKSDIIKNGHNWGIDLISTICLLDIRRFQNQRLLEMPYWHSLLEVSDTILGTKADKCDTDKVLNFQSIMEPYALEGKSVFTNRKDLLQGGWTRNPRGLSTVDHSHDCHSGHRHSPEEKPNTSGWVFPQEIVFPINSLIDLLNKYREDTLRIKGIFQTDDGTFALQSVEGEPIEIKAINHKGDNRLEVIWNKDEAMNATAMTDALQLLSKN